MGTNQQSNQGQGKLELKEYIDKAHVVGVLRKWITALENNQDLVVNVKGEDCTIPKDTFDKSKIKLEYEVKNGEYEFELEMKWRPDQQSYRQ